ncbi:hypothetical protein J6590_016803 [Homalodisca vitripennis]|nr:hypothetical protein J6590_016803 [Homalodisca vitripennis]
MPHVLSQYTVGSRGRKLLESRHPSGIKENNKRTDLRMPHVLSQYTVGSGGRNILESRHPSGIKENYIRTCICLMHSSFYRQDAFRNESFLTVVVNSQRPVSLAASLSLLASGVIRISGAGRFQNPRSLWPNLTDPRNPIKIHIQGTSQLPPLAHTPHPTTSPQYKCGPQATQQSTQPKCLAASGVDVGRGDSLQLAVGNLKLTKWNSIMVHDPPWGFAEH